MTISFSVATAGNSTVSTVSYATSSISPAANDLILAAVISDYGNSATAAGHATPTLTGNGLTWVLVAGVNYDSAAGDDSTWYGRMDLFRAQGPAPTAGAVSISYASAPASSVLWHIALVAGCTTGSAGDTCIVQSATTHDLNASGSISSTACTLAAWGKDANSGYAVFAAGRNPAASMTAVAGAGMTTLGSPQLIGFQSLFAEFCTASATTVSASFNNLMSGIGGIALELNAVANTPGQLSMQGVGA